MELITTTLYNCFVSYSTYNFLTSFLLRLGFGYCSLSRKHIHVVGNQGMAGGLSIISAWTMGFFLESCGLALGTFLLKKYNFAYNLSNFWMVPLYSIMTWPLIERCRKD